MSAAVVVPVVAAPGFDANDPKYRCCCGSCHVKTGTTVIAVLYAIGLVLEVLNLLAQISAGNGYGVINPLVTLIIGVPVVVLMFLALKHERAGYLLPYLVLQIVGIVALCIFTLVWIVLLAVGSVFLNKLFKEGDNTKADADTLTAAVIVMGIIMIVVLLVVIAISIWCFLVVLNCYQYFKEKAFGDVVPGQQQIGVAYSGYPGYPAGYPVMVQGQITQPPYNPQQHQMKQ